MYACTGCTSVVVRPSDRVSELGSSSEYLVCVSPVQEFGTTHSKTPAARAA